MFRTSALNSTFAPRLTGALLAGVAALALAVIAAGPARSQAPVTLDASVVPFGNEVQVLGPAAPGADVRFQVALRLRDADVLSAGNASGQVLSFGQLEKRHLPTAADYATVVDYLSNMGLKIEAKSPERLTVEASGSAGQLSHIFGMHFSRIRFGGEEMVSADTAPVLPAALAPLVQGVNGLQPQVRVYPMHVFGPDSATKPPLFPQAFLSAYVALGITNGGQGATTAIIIDTFPKTTDLTKFWSATGVSQSLSNISFIQVNAGKLPAPSGEESLDVETSSSLAPKSKVRVYASRTLSDADLDRAFQAVITDIHNGVKITEVSISLGGCESATPKAQAQTDDNFFSVMSSLGVSVFVSSGDSGSHECGKKKPDTPSFYSTSPNVTAVGGTNLRLTSAGVPASETAWTGSGGGISTIFTRPKYQKGLGYKARVVPDVSADADPSTGALVIVSGIKYQIGGTSLSSPIWAGLMALVNSERLTAGKTGLGLINASVYPLRDTVNFRDITTGDNGGFDAGPGYDLVTGIGSPIMDSLAPNLVAKP